MTDIMTEEAKKVLQIAVLKRTHNRFKADAAEIDLDMSELGQLVLDWLHECMESEKLPPDLTKAIEKYKKARDSAKD